VAAIHLAGVRGEIVAPCVGRTAPQVSPRSFQPHYGLGVDSASNRNEYQAYFLGDKDSRCVGLTTLPPSCPDRLEIWEPQIPGSLRSCPGLSHRPLGLRRRFSAARMLRLWVRIPPGAWVTVCCECCVLSGRGLCEGLITRPEESYGMCCVVVCDPENSWMIWPWPTWGCGAKNKKIRPNINQVFCVSLCTVDKMEIRSGRISATYILTRHVIHLWWKLYITFGSERCSVQYSYSVVCTYNKVRLIVQLNESDNNALLCVI